jgi:hypothetical protein
MNMYDTEDTVVAGKIRFVYGVQQFRIEIRNPDYNFSVTFFSRRNERRYYTKRKCVFIHRLNWFFICHNFHTFREFI